MRIISVLEKSGVPVRSLVLFHDLENGELFIAKHLQGNEYEIVTDEVIQKLEENEYNLIQFLKNVPLDTYLMKPIIIDGDYAEYKLDANTKVVRDGKILKVLPIE